MKTWWSVHRWRFHDDLLLVSPGLEPLILSINTFTHTLYCTAHTLFSYSSLSTAADPSWTFWSVRPPSLLQRPERRPQPNNGAARRDSAGENVSVFKQTVQQEASTAKTYRGVACRYTFTIHHREAAQVVMTAVEGVERVCSANCEGFCQEVCLSLTQTGGRAQQ